MDKIDYDFNSEHATLRYFTILILSMVKFVNKIYCAYERMYAHIVCVTGDGRMPHKLNLDSV